MADRFDQLDRTLRSHFRILYDRQRLRFGSDETRKQYLINLGHFDDFLGRPATLDDLTDDTVSDLLSWFLKRERGNAPRTANKCRDNILALWRFLARKHIVDKWPDVDPVPEPDRVPVAWTKDELRRLFEVCEAQTGTFAGVPQNAWWHCIHAVAWDSAERITPVRRLRFPYVDLSGGWAVFPAETRKGSKRGRRQDRIVRLHPHTVDAIRAIELPKRDDVFPWPYSPTYLWHRYNSMLKEADLPHDRAHKFHCLRKSAASYFEAAGHDATKLLGHSSRRVTERYLDPRVIGQTHACDVLFRP